MAVLSVGWVFPLCFSAVSTLRYMVTAPTGIQSFPRGAESSVAFILGFLWLVAVVVFWSWRCGGHRWWLIAALSIGGLIPVWIAVQRLFREVETVLGSGNSLPAPVPNGAGLMLDAGIQVLWFSSLWFAAVTGFWAWRLGGKPTHHDATMSGPPES